MPCRRRRFICHPGVLLLLCRFSWAALAPTPESGWITQVTARLIEQSHYNHPRIDAAASRKALHNYVDSLDYNHLIFEKADVDGFESLYGDGLGDRLKHGDVQPAYDIFGKFLERLETRVQLVNGLLDQKYDFNVDESFAPDRHDALWPASAEESQKLWRLRVKYELLQERLSRTKPEEQAKTIKLRYERFLRSVKEYDASDVLQSYLTALAHVFDPHSDYLAAPQKENFDISMKLSLTGIGAVLRSEDGYAKIVSLVPGGPADVDKRLKPNDKIEAVAQGDGPFLEVVGMKLDRLVQLIRGEKNSMVRLRVIPAAAIDPSMRVVIALIRDEIKLTDQEAKAKLIELPRGGRIIKVGVIDLPSFYADMQAGGDGKSTTRDVGRLIAELKKQGMGGLLIDLRRNGGGSLAEAVSLTGLFITEGPVVQIKDSHGGIRILKDADSPISYAGPLVVLTSRMSASASEIFAAALQDYGRAVVVGEKSTFGKGTVQSMLDLGQYMPSHGDFKPGALKLTIQKFYRISGGTTQNRGVLPDIHVPAVADYVEGTESSLKNAMAYDQVEQASYARSDYLLAILPQLEKASTGRVTASTEFGYLREDIAHYQEEIKDKAVSLNEKTRLAEKKVQEDREIARKKARLAQPAPNPKIQDITLASIAGIAAPAPRPAAEQAKSSSTVSGKSGEQASAYEQAPPAPDIHLEEGMNILGDLLSLNLVPESAEHRPKDETIH